MVEENRRRAEARSMPAESIQPNEQRNDDQQGVINE